MQPPMVIAHIVAMSKNRVIGRAGGLPWHLAEDLQFFRKITTGHAVIMGRKTWDSINRPLPNRLMIVVSRKILEVPAGVMVMTSIDTALRYCQSQPQWGEKCFVIGGGQVYKETLPQTQEIYLTEIDQVIDGDTFYPEWEPGDFELAEVLNRDEYVLDKNENPPRQVHVQWTRWLRAPK